MPDLHRIDTMPVRTLAARQQEIDRGGEGASIGVAARVAKRLAIVAALGVRLEFKPGDDVGSGGQQSHQDLFLRSRRSPKTSPAPRPFIRTPSATDASSARRNSLAF